MRVFPRRPMTLGHLRMPPNCAAEGSRSEPEAHKDIVDVLVADPDVPPADALLSEAEGVVQSPGPDVRCEHSQLGLRESARPYPFEDARPHPAPEARFP